MKGLFFGHTFLSGGQKTLQAGHVIGELFLQHQFGTKPRENLYNWVEFHKTIIAFDGGDCQDLQEIYEVIETIGEDHDLPYGQFFESKRSLNGALTSVGIIVPGYTYDPTFIVKDAMASLCKTELQVAQCGHLSLGQRLQALTHGRKLSNL